MNKRETYPPKRGQQIYERPWKVDEAERYLDIPITMYTENGGRRNMMGRTRKGREKKDGRRESCEDKCKTEEDQTARNERKRRLKGGEARKERKEERY